MPRCAFACLLFLATLSAQAAEPQGPTIQPPRHRLELRGPAAWRAALLPTNLGTMLASEQGSALWHDTVAALDQRWAGLLGDAGKFQAARQRLLAYSGRVVVRVHPDDYITGQSWVIEPDGHTDLSAIAADFASLIERRTEQAPVRQEIAGCTLEVTVRPRPWCNGFALGELPDGRLLFAAAGSIEDLVQVVPFALQAMPAPKAGDPLLRWQYDLAVALQPSLAEMAAEDVARVKRICEVSGLQALRTLTFTVQPNGPHLQGELSLDTVGDRGVFAGLFPELPGAPDLSGLLPKTVLAGGSCRMDGVQVWNAMLAYLAAMYGQSIAEVAAGFTASTGGDAGKDLLARLTGEVLLVWDAQAADEDEWLPPITVAARVRDGKAFRAAFRNLLAGARTKGLDDGVALRASTFSGRLWPAMELGVQDDVVVVAIGAGAGPRVDALLAARSAQPLAEPGGTQGPALAGCNGRGFLDVETFLEHHTDSVIGQVHELLGEYGAEASSLTPLLRQARPLLQKHQLHRMSLLLGTERGRTVLRALW